MINNFLDRADKEELKAYVEGAKKDIETLTNAIKLTEEKLKTSENNLIGNTAETSTEMGKTVEEQLFRVGINSALELKRIGVKEAWLKIQEIDETACI